MKLYADLPARRSRQVLGDVAVVCWAGVWIYLGRAVHDAVMILAGPGRQLASAGDGFHGKMLQAGDAVDHLPVLDDKIAGPFRSASGLGTDLASAGHGLVGAVTTLSTWLGWVSALVPILIVTGLWLFVRIRFVRRASAAQRFIDGAADLDLFALRAMAHQPMQKLAEITDDPSGAWRRGDTAVIHRLALLELRDVGLRPPTQVTAS